jgi:hypothetical protein
MRSSPQVDPCLSFHYLDGYRETFTMSLRLFLRYRRKNDMRLFRYPLTNQGISIT